MTLPIARESESIALEDLNDPPCIEEPVRIELRNDDALLINDPLNELLMLALPRKLILETRKLVLEEARRAPVCLEFESDYY